MADNSQAMEALKALNPTERAYALKALEELQTTGKSKLLEDLVYADYNEIPVDINTFVEDDQYLGRAWHDAAGKLKMFPYWQKKLRELFPDNIHTSVNTFIESGGRGLGKAQPLDSQILSQTGFVPMRDISVGDKIYGEDGQLHDVIGVFPQGLKKVYQVEFSDGSKTKCSDEHLWKIHKQGKSDDWWKVVELKELINAPTRKLDSRKYNNHQYKIPMASPIMFDKKQNFIDPYLLGVLLGDGTISYSDYIKITSVDSEIIDKINEIVCLNNYHLSILSDNDYGIVSNSRLPSNRMNDEPNNLYVRELKQLQLLGCTSKTKFIPFDYLYNSVENRIALLQGLLDTDGYINKDGSIIQFTSISPRLIQDTSWLIQSLGGTAKLHTKMGSYKNKLGEKVETNLAYTLNIKLPKDISPFRLPRKLARVNPKAFTPNRYIEKITYIGEEECQCIMLDSASHLYITDEFIVTHNTEIAVTCVLYIMYRLMCMKNPFLTYNLKNTEKFCFAFMNITKALAEDIGVSKFQETVQKSPWFMARGKMTGRDVILWNPPDFINIIVGSQVSDVIGKPIFACFFDEVSFQRNKDVEKQKEKAYELMNTALGGMKTRFTNKGQNYATLIMASSKRSESSFLEDYIKLKMKSENTKSLIVDEPTWNIRPATEYSGVRFYVALGNRFLNSEVLPKDTTELELEIWKSKGYKILDVPIEYIDVFEQDIDKGLCDYAGISSTDLTTYISGVRLMECVNKDIKNPFTKEVLEVGNNPEDHAQYADFFDLSQVPPELKSRPLYIHLDMSVSGDKTGIGGVWIVDKKHLSQSTENANEDVSKELYFKLAFSVSIKAPKGYQISFEKHRQFIYWLKNQGFNIKSVSSDTYQSADMKQALLSKGYDYQTISVDRVSPNEHINLPYQYFKSTIYEHRIEMYPTDLLTQEIVGLEKNSTNGYVDHSPNGINSKDQADGCCLSPDTEIFLLSGEHKTIQELFYNHDNEWILAYNTETNKLEPVQIQDVVNNGYRDDLVKLTFDNGKSLICTEDHKLLCRDGQYFEAKDCLGVSLMPFNYENRVMYDDRDYPYVYNPNPDGTLTGIYLHKLVCENLFSSEKLQKQAEKGPGEWVVIHHEDTNRYNARPNNLSYVTNVEHSKIHTQLNQSDKKREQLRESNRKLLEEGKHPFQKIPMEKRVEVGKIQMTAWNKSDEHRRRVTENNKKLAAIGQHPFQLYKDSAHTDEANLKRYITCAELYGGVGFNSDIIQEKCRESCLNNNGYDNPFHSTEMQHQMKINKLKKAYNKVLEYLKLTTLDSITLLDFKLACYALNLGGVSAIPADIIEANINIDTTSYDENFYNVMRNKGNCIRIYIKSSGATKFRYSEFSDYYDKMREVDRTFRYRFKLKPSYEDCVRLGFDVYNHTVVKLERVSGSEVYDIKLDKIHNFALLCGIFAHNCGAIYNAAQHAEEFAYDFGEDLGSVLKVSAPVLNNTEYRQQVNVDFEQEMQKLMDPMYKTAMQSQSTIYYDSDGRVINNNANPLQSQQPVFLYGDGIVIW